MKKGNPELNRFSDIGSALNLELQHLQWLVYERGDSQVDHYIRFTIPKRSGGTRLISKPRPSLQKAQQWVQDTILRSQPLHPAAMAFRPGVSIVDNARLHSGAQVVVRLDLKDFFPTITFARVRGLFESFGYNPGVATVLSLLCTDSPRVMVSLDGCVFCRQARQSHLSPMALAGTVIVQVDMRNNQPVLDFAGKLTTHDELTRRWKVSITPTLLFFGPGGNEAAERMEGATLPDFYGP